MTTSHHDAAASAVTTGLKLAGVWGAVLAGFSNFPWASLAAALACVWTLHLIVGWWIDRLRDGRDGRGARRDRRKP